MTNTIHIDEIIHLCGNQRQTERFGILGGFTRAVPSGMAKLKMRMTGLIGAWRTEHEHRMEIGLDHRLQSRPTRTIEPRQKNPAPSSTE